MNSNIFLRKLTEPEFLFIEKMGYSYLQRVADYITAIDLGLKPVALTSFPNDQKEKILELFKNRLNHSCSKITFQLIGGGDRVYIWIHRTHSPAVYLILRLENIQRCLGDDFCGVRAWDCLLGLIFGYDFEAIGAFDPDNWVERLENVQKR